MRRAPRAITRSAMSAPALWSSWRTEAASGMNPGALS